MGGVAPGLGRVARMIKLEHSIFALPFALLSLALAAGGWPGWRTLGLILVSAVAARTAAMTNNRIVDRAQDARNPRTAGRELPTGAVSVLEARIWLIAASAVFLVAPWGLNRLCGLLAPLALLWILGYSYTKRFTAWSHLILGLSLALAPLGAWLAVRGRVQAIPLVLVGVVATWVAGFDVLYSLADEAFDRREGLFSAPAALGVKGALRLARALHVLSFAGMAWLYVLLEIPAWGWLALVPIAALFVYQHHLVRPPDLSRLNTAFFTMNGYISILFALLTGLVAFGR